MRNVIFSCAFLWHLTYTHPRSAEGRFGVLVASPGWHTAATQIPAGKSRHLPFPVQFSPFQSAAVCRGVCLQRARVQRQETDLYWEILHRDFWALKSSNCVQKHLPVPGDTGTGGSVYWLTGHVWIELWWNQASGLKLWVWHPEFQQEQIWSQHVLLPSSHHCTKSPLPDSSAHRQWHQGLVLPLGFVVCPQLTHHRAAAWLLREETPARQEHPRAAELLSSEAPCPVSVFPTHAVARAKAGSSCEQPESFLRESFIPAK